MNNENEHKNKRKAKAIAKKYTFSTLQYLTKEELIGKYKELHSLQSQKEKQIVQLERQIENLEAKIISLTEKLSIFYGTNDTLQKFVGYDTEWLYIDKITFVIERSNKPLTSLKIVEVLLKLEPSLKQRLLNPLKSITKVIYTALKLNTLIRHKKTGHYGWTYILPDRTYAV
jgi:CRISPR/Cas system CMR subunit Cmr4 (Cas7 group RAMP superfamily)